MKFRLPTYLLILLAIILSAASPALVIGQNNSGIVLKKPQENPNKVKEQLAMSYYRNRQFEKAEVIYKELYSANPRTYYYTYYLNCLIYLDKAKEADKLVKQQLKHQPGNARIKVDQIYVYDLMGNTRRSGKLMQQLLRDLPEDRNQVINIAAALESKGFYNEALEVYNNAKSVPGVNYDYNLEKARVYQYTGDYENMFDAYLMHLDLQPQSMQIIKNRMQTLMRVDVDDNLSGILKMKLLEKAQANPDNLVYAEMLMWHVMQTKDFEMAYRQARAIDMRFEGHEEEMLEVADICYMNKQYELAAKAYGYIKDKKDKTLYYADSYAGYYLSLVRETESKPGRTEKEYKSLKKTGEKALEELGINLSTVSIVQELSHIMAFKLNEFDEAMRLLESALVYGNLTAVEQSGIKLELADILLFKEKVWDATLLYSQIENDMKNEPIGHEAKFRNARLYYYIGEYTWSLTKLDILKSATSKLISNDAIELSLFINELFEEDTLGNTLKMFGKADLYAYRELYDSSLLWLDKIEDLPGGMNSYEHIVYRKADVMVQKQEYHQADSLYGYLAQYYPESIKADNALFKQAELKRLFLGEDEKAKAIYLKLMTEYPESIYAGEGRKEYRKLRGEYGEEEAPNNSNDP